MTKKEVPNAFNTPSLFKIDTLSFKRSAAGMVGGRVRSANADGDAVPALKTKNTEKYRRPKDEETK
jgi:hypothetical protein